MSSLAFPVIQRDRRSWSVFLVGALMAVVASAAWAAAAPDPAGRVIRSLGVVEAVAPDGTIRRLRRQDPVFEGDTLRTGARGRAQVRFTDRGLMSLRPETELAIDDYEYDARAPSTARQQLRLSRGGFRAATGRVADGNRAGYRVSTPLAVIGVRGTLWSARQTAGGPLALGVEEGGIEATSSSGRTATLGLGAGYDFARINPDGSVDYFVEPPAELAAGSGIEEAEDDDGGDGDGGGDGADEEGGDFGGGDEAGQADAPAAAGGEAASTALAATTNNPENSGAISQSESGTGSVATEQPIPGIDVFGALTAEEQAALQEGFFFVGAFGFAETGVAGGRTIDPRPDGGTQPLTFNAVTLGEGIESSVPGDGAFLDLPPDFVIRNTGQVRRFVDGVAIPGGESLSASVWRSDGLFVGADGTVLGSGIDVFDAVSGDPLGLSFDAVHLISGQPTAIADLVGSFSYSSASLLTGSLFTDVAGPDTALTGIEFFFNVDFTDGRIFDGSLDLFAGSTSPVIGLIFDGSVGGEGAVNGASLDIIEGFFGGNGSLDLDRSEMGGFFAGATGEAFAGAFSLYEFGGNGAALGTFVAQQGVFVPPVPPNALTPAEAELLGAGFGYVEANCCFVGTTFQGNIIDPRLSLGADTIIAGGANPLEANFADLTPNDVILRRDGATLINYRDDFSTVGGAQLSSFEWQGFGAGGPVGLYSASTGDLFSNIDGNVLVLAGLRADVADLTGHWYYELDQLSQGFYLGVGGATVAPAPLEGGEISFSVDFATAMITGGFARLFTDPDDAGAIDSFQRDRIDAFFDGTVALANGNPHVVFNVGGGFVADSDGDAGGSGIVDPAASSMTGFFAGDGTVFNLAFNYTTAADPEFPADFIEPINAVGTAILRRRDLSLSATELDEFALGFAFAAAECCGPNIGTGAGPAGNPFRVNGSAVDTDGDFVLALNTDGMGEILSPLDPGFLDATPEELARRLGAFGFAIPDFPTPAEAQLVVGGWRSAGGTAAVADASTGEIIDQLGNLLFMAAIPSDVAVLQSQGFLTFSGSSREFFTDPVTMTSFETVGGLIDTNIQQVLPVGVLEPSDVFVGQNAINAPALNLSFNVDFSTGTITNGQLFTALIGNTADGSDVGFQLFFDGSLNLGTGGNAFAELNVREGSLGGGLALNFDDTDLELFFIGDPVNGEGLVAVGSYTAVTVPTTDFPDPIAVGGTFSVGQLGGSELRLGPADALALNSGRLGIVAYSDLAFDPFDGFTIPGADAPGASGLILGRASDPATGADFLLGGNELIVPATDPTTGLPIMGVDISTERRDFFRQPYAFVVRQDTAFVDPMLFSADVVPTGGASFAGFEVKWGAWNGSPDSIPFGARIQDAPGDAAAGVTIDRELYFTSVNPTPQSQMPITGMFTYSTSAAGSFGTDFIGSGGGDLLSGAFGSQPLSTLDVSFALDFTTGDITSGSFATSYTDGMSTVEWVGAFDGFVNGALADTRFSSLDILFDGSPSGFFGDPVSSELTGIFTGPNGERMVGGFNLTGGDGLSSFEGASGVFIMSRGGAL